MTGCRFQCRCDSPPISTGLAYPQLRWQVLSAPQNCPFRSLAAFESGEWCHQPRSKHPAAALARAEATPHSTRCASCRAATERDPARDVLLSAMVLVLPTNRTSIHVEVVCILQGSERQRTDAAALKSEHASAPTTIGMVHSPRALPVRDFAEMKENCFTNDGAQLVLCSKSRAYRCISS